MKDIEYSFDTNDIAIENGDFKLNEDASRQNAALLLAISPANVFQPQWGIGFNPRSIQSTYSEASRMVGEATRQIKRDGASECRIWLTPESNGDYKVEMNVRYQ